MAAGCGGGDGNGNGGGDHRLIAAVGDSITAGYPGYDPDPTLRGRIHAGANPKSQWEYWAQRRHPALRIRNCGGFGEDTSRIAQDFDQCTMGVDGVVIQGGINDIALGLPVEATAANLQGMVRSAKELNLDVAIANLLPLNVGNGRADGAIADLNQRIRRIAQEEHVTLLPFHDALQDPAAPGRMKPKWTADGEHPSVEGYRRLGELAFRPPGE
jgi:lysophospholipase L1-like esterase